ncbi:cytochrome b [Streptomyces thinghirensis]|nr:cytochrome b [Streptomyces thinghirensis]
MFFTGAFRKPREINWLYRFLLFVLGMFTGFTGYSLPDDLALGTGVRFTQGAILSVPIVGTYISDVPVRRGVPRDRLRRPVLLHPYRLLRARARALVGHLIPVFYHKHTQVPRSRQDQQERRRHAVAAGVHGEGRRLLLPGSGVIASSPASWSSTRSGSSAPTGRTWSPRAPSPTGTWASLGSGPGHARL